jgi:plastocyanin
VYFNMVSENRKFSLTFLLIFLTLTMSAFSFPFQLANYVNADSESNSNEGSNDDGDDDANDDGDDDANDDGDDDANDDGDDDANDDGDDDANDDGDDTDDQNSGDSQTSETGDSQTSETGDSQTSETGDSQTSETGDSQTSETGDSQTSETGDSQTSAIQGTTPLASIISPLQLLPSRTQLDSEQNSQELSTVNSILDICDPADPACSEPCDPEDANCSQPSETNPTDGESDCANGVDDDGDDAIDGEDPDCSSTGSNLVGSGETDCGDGIDNDGDDAIDGEDADCSPGGGLPPNEREKFCSDGVDNDGNGKVDDINECESDCTDGTDNDGDGKIDTEDNDCQPGGPCPLCSPTGGGAGGSNDDREDQGNPNDRQDQGNPIRDASADNDNDGESNRAGESVLSFIPEAGAQAAQGQNGKKVYYILIENSNNETNFVPNKVTLTDEFTVIWINKDSSKDHSLTIENSSGQPLFNSVVQPNNFVKYQFQSEGTFSYSDPDNPQYSGIITILKSGLASENEISKPVRGIDLILSSLGIN